MAQFREHQGRPKEKGAVLVLVAILLVVFIGMAALAVDLGYLYVVRNELQNAADAGALAGARFLYNEEGTSVNPGANQIAFDAATANNALAAAGAEPVEVHWSPDVGDGNEGDVQRGHWTFATRTFTPNDSLLPVELWGVSDEDLDGASEFINAIRVVTRRENAPAAAFFSRIFGFQSFALTAEAVGYIGFAGSLGPGEADQPIAICKQALVDGDGNYNCSTGRMINSGGGTTHNTGAWTNFSQPCQTASAQSVRPLVCSAGNLESIAMGDGIGTQGGMQDNVYRDLRDCWLGADVSKDWRGYPTQPWGLTLPVIDCPGNNPGTCSEVVGAVTLDIVWIKQSGADPQWTDIPLQMSAGGTSWVCSSWKALGSPEDINALTSAERQECWGEFADAFGLRTYNDVSVGTLSASDLQKTMYFLPSCEVHEPAGNTGGANFGVLARIPVLVR
ncbi:MAG: TadG family pilus assembly protein [Deferrisomatales bacterium]|nr:TadG family pilus assembly protein [Deferrisomatales bacterium]